MLHYTRPLTNREQHILEHDLLDITDWINKAIDGKITNCLKRAAQSYREKQKSLGVMVVSLDDQYCFDELLKDPAYKNRRERENNGNIQITG